MDKKISEMTEDELRDYALELENTNKTLTEERDKVKGDYEELTTLNKALQKRNNDLFLKVEQQHTDTDKKDEQEGNADPETCEDYGVKISKEIFK